MYFRAVLEEVLKKKTINNTAPVTIISCLRRVPTSTHASRATARDRGPRGVPLAMTAMHRGYKPRPTPSPAKKRADSPTHTPSRASVAMSVWETGNRLGKFMPGLSEEAKYKLVKVRACMRVGVRGCVGTSSSQRASATHTHPLLPRMAHAGQARRGAQRSREPGARELHCAVAGADGESCRGWGDGGG